MQSVQQMEIGAVALRYMLENMKKYLERYLESHRVASKTLLEKLAHGGRASPRMARVLLASGRAEG